LNIIPGKSASELQGFLSYFNGWEKVNTVCVDLCSAFSLVRRHCPNAILLVEGFHKVLAVPNHFIQLARYLEPTAFFCEDERASRWFFPFVISKQGKLTL